MLPKILQIGRVWGDIGVLFHFVVFGYHFTCHSFIWQIMINDSTSAWHIAQRQLFLFTSTEKDNSKNQLQFVFSAICVAFMILRTTKRLLKEASGKKASIYSLQKTSLVPIAARNSSKVASRDKGIERPKLGLTVWWKRIKEFLWRFRWRGRTQISLWKGSYPFLYFQHLWIFMLTINSLTSKSLHCTTRTNSVFVSKVRWLESWYLCFWPFVLLFVVTVVCWQYVCGLGKNAQRIVHTNANSLFHVIYSVCVYVQNLQKVEQKKCSLLSSLIMCMTSWNHLCLETITVACKTYFEFKF